MFSFNLVQWEKEESKDDLELQKIGDNKTQFCVCVHVHMHMYAGGERKLLEMILKNILTFENNL